MSENAESYLQTQIPEDMTILSEREKEWRNRVQCLLAWYNAHDKTWPRNGLKNDDGKHLIREEMTPEQQEEVKNGKLLNRLRSGAKKMKQGVTDLSKLDGMTQDRLEYVDATLPDGWIGYRVRQDFKTRVDDLLAWYHANGERWPRTAIVINGKTLTHAKMTPDEREEIKLGSFLRQQRGCRAAALREEDRPFVDVDKSKFKPISQDRLDYLNATLPEGWVGDDDRQEWSDRVQQIVDWYTSHSNTWPRSTISRSGKQLTCLADMTPEEREECGIAKFLCYLRQGRTRLLKGEKQIRFMTQERLDYLDATLPEGWAGVDREEKWRDTVQSILTWYTRHGETWPRASIYVDWKEIRSTEMTPEQKQETHLGGSLGKLRAGRNAFLNGETDPQKLHGISQERLEYLNTILPEDWWDNKDEKRVDIQWKQTVQNLLMWYNTHGETWPRCRNFHDTEMTVEQQEEKNLAVFLSNIRTGRNYFLRVGPNRKYAMTQERLDYLNATLPESWVGNADGREWRAKVQNLLEWYTKKGTWPRITTKSRQKNASMNETPEEQEELYLASFLGNQRRGRNILLRGEKGQKNTGMTQERLDYLNSTLPESWVGNADDREWRAKVQKLLAWYNRKNAWPKRPPKRHAVRLTDMNPDQVEESRLAEFLSTLRHGRKALVSGNTGQYKLLGMNQERLDYLDATLPHGWERSTSIEVWWRENVKKLYAWYMAHDKAWPRHGISKHGKQLSIAQMTPEEQEEVRLGSFLEQTRSKRRKFLECQTAGHQTQVMTQERLDYLNDMLPEGWETATWRDQQWTDKVQKLLAWYNEKGQKWPRATIFRDGKQLNVAELPPEQREELRLGRFLITLRQGRISLLKGDEQKPLLGMNQERLEYLNNTLPDRWYDGKGDDKEWRETVGKLLQWYNARGKTWPRSTIFGRKQVSVADMTPDENEEYYLGRFLTRFRSGRLALLTGDTTKLQGMTQERLDYLDATLPRGWEDATEEDKFFRTKVHNILAWFTENGEKWPRSSIKGEDGKKLTKATMTPKQHEEVNLGSYLGCLRDGRNALLKGETDPQKLRYMTQERLNYLNDTFPFGWEDPYARDLHERAQELLAWYNRNNKTWPRTEIRKHGKHLQVDEMNRAQRQEVTLGAFLSKQRGGRKALLRGETNQSKLQGMNRDRLDYLDKLLPKGWEDATGGDGEWRGKVQNLLAWYNGHGKTWPRKTIVKGGKRFAASEQTLAEREETICGSFRQKLVEGRKAFLEGETNVDKLAGMNQDRLDYLNATLPEGWNIGRKRKRDQQDQLQ